MDYEKVYEEVLKRLEALKEIEKESENFDEVKEGCNKMVYDFEAQKDLPENVRNTIQNLKETGYEPGEIMDMAINFVKGSKNYIEKSKNQRKELEDNKEIIKKEIGETLLSDAKKTGTTERSMHFPHFGTVKCNLVPIVEIEDKEKVIEAIYQDEKLRKQYLLLSKKITKYKDANTIDGLKVTNDYVVSIKGEK